MRVFTASLATETNTFSPLPTDRAAFEAGFYAGPGEHPETPTLCSSPVPILRRRGREEGFTVIEGSSTWAEPAGLIKQETFEELRDEILDQLRAALPVDGVVLGLHGAMVAQGYDDCEGDLLERVRAIVGPDVVLAAEFDPHSHLTAKRVAQLDIAAAFLEFPHTDFQERGAHVVDLALRTLRGEITPVISTFDCRMIGIYPTSQQPMRGFVDRMKVLEGQGAILSCSVIHGFMAGDVPEMGTRILVVSDNAPEEGAALAQRLGEELYALRGQTAMAILDYEEGIDLARETYAADPSKPVTIADTWDNPGGGCAGDGTFVLRSLIARQVERVAVGAIWDPIAVSFCHAAGQGAHLRLRFGGKAGAEAGLPIDADIEVRHLSEEGHQSFRASRVSLGRSATVRIIGTEIDIVLISSRTQTYEPTLFSNQGVDFTGKEILLVKSTNHFHAGFDPVSSRIIHVDSPSSYPTKPALTDYRKAGRDFWPKVADPLGLDEATVEKEAQA
ncbi:M81 family metallopeptidase [Allosediminivita pacifica]|uniref:Microcystinase C n=1 Tax=Allosediminivita pacifica TaxID=1267769 RepID=A0A2T6BA83_9RHOB|nr:M81 family metallopeptidase [Allosediminivita pacifica]PTX52974.1 microcystin degradation protein MlrC [Allosediminivita pacifica]GGA94079.1 microcystinase C [Allosediminivita pacifica]